MDLQHLRDTFARVAPGPGCAEAGYVEILDAAIQQVDRLRDRLARAERQRDALAGAARLAEVFLSEVVAYGLARQEKGEIRKALRAALAGLDGETGGEGVE